MLLKNRTHGRSTFVSFYRLYRQLRGLLPHLMNRFLVGLRSFMGARPYYPSEKEITYPQTILKILKEIEYGMRNSGYWGDYSWDTIFEKEEKSRDITRIISNVLPFSAPPALINHVGNLQTSGLSKLEDKSLTLDQVSSIHEYLLDKPVYPSYIAHWSGRPPSNHENVKKSGSLYGSYDIGTILRAPALAKMIGDPQVIGTISDYFGCVPTICSINLFWSFYQHGKPSGVTQQFHRDVDDYKSSNYFCLLTDTSNENGAYFHIENTHTFDATCDIFNPVLNTTLDPDLNPFGQDLSPDDFFRLPYSRPQGHGYDSLYEHCFSSHVKSIHGKAGLPVLTDGYGLHKGSPPVAGGNDRLLFWTTYCLTNSAISGIATNPHSLFNINLPPWKRVPYSALSSEFSDDEVARYVMRNIVDFC